MSAGGEGHSITEKDSAVSKMIFCGENVSIFPFLAVSRIYFVLIQMRPCNRNFNFFKLKFRKFFILFFPPELDLIA